MKTRLAAVIIVVLLISASSYYFAKRGTKAGSDLANAPAQSAAGSSTSPVANPTGSAPNSSPVPSPIEAAAALKPPQGAKLAIVVFEDLQCPACSQVETLLAQAAQNYKIPIIRHDYLIPNHNWSPEAHVFARYFDTQSPALGEAYRHWILENQRTVNKNNLRTMTEQFAVNHKVALPLFADPNGEFAAKVKADGALGKALGINETPTIFVVSSAQMGSAVKLQDRTKLFETIDQMKRAVEAEAGDKSASPSKVQSPKKSSQGLE